MEIEKLKKSLRLYAVTDRGCVGARNTFDCVRDALDGGVTIVQLREKKLSFEEFLDEAKEISKLTAARKVPLIINDNVEIAKLCGAGVHVGQSDTSVREARKKLGGGAIIGASARCVEQALEAQAQGADYLGVGAVFGTNTKNDAKTISVDILKEICASVDIPVVAIGGVSENNIHLLKDSGISGVAVVSALFAKDDIKSAARELRQKLEEIGI